MKGNKGAGYVVLTREEGERVYAIPGDAKTEGDVVEVYVGKTQDGKVKLGFKGPQDVTFVRPELIPEGDLGKAIREGWHKDFQRRREGEKENEQT